MPRFYSRTAKNRRAARNPGDPDFGPAAFLRSGGEESACRMQSGRPGFQICWAFTIRPLGIGAPHGTQSGRPRRTRSRIRDLGRWGPRSGAPARRGVGKTLHFLNGDCEGLVFLPSTLLSWSGCRACDVFPRAAGLPRPKEQRRSYTQRRN